nr:venom lipolysis activating peptide beta subunit isoform x2 [Hottentotta saulcyi]
MKVIFPILFAIIAVNLVSGENYYPTKQDDKYYGCQNKPDSFCNKICKLHLAREGGFCHQPGPAVHLCKCINIDEDNTSFWNALRKQCSKLSG